MTQSLENTPASWSERAGLPCALEAVGWTEEGQRDRFRAVLAALDPQPGESLLDFGCGTGALVDHLPDGGIDYMGYDWAEGMIQRARADHPGVLFVDRWPSRRFDLVAAVGPFNLPGAWSKQHTYSAIRFAWDSTNCRALAVSLYAGTDERCLRYDIDELAEVGRALGHDHAVIQHRHNDLVLVARRASR